MDIENLFGLPAHPLLVHVPVVLLPLCAAGAVVIVLIPSWRPRFGLALVALAGLSVVAAQLAAGSGEALEDALDRDSAALDRHAELGETFVWFALVFFVALAAFVAWDLWQRRRAADAGQPVEEKVAARRPVAIVLALALVASSLVVGFRTYQVGHSGAESVWQDDSRLEDSSSSGSGGDEETEEGQALRPQLVRIER